MALVIGKYELIISDRSHEKYEIILSGQNQKRKENGYWTIFVHNSHMRINRLSKERSLSEEIKWYTVLHQSTQTIQATKADWPLGRTYCIARYTIKRARIPNPI
jgi:hypothetical protein